MAGSIGPDQDKSVEVLIDRDIVPRGITDREVLEAMRSVPRHAFLPADSASRAYENVALPIGYGQTISQPLMIALMLQALDVRSGAIVLEVGTGSGYQAALLRAMGARVVTMERIEALASEARERLSRLGYEDVTVVVRDGSLGLAESAPYDRIIVACGAPAVPQALKQQLAEGGRLVVPVGPRSTQRLTIVVRRGETFSVETRDECVFVPLVGADGWQPDEETN